MRSRLVVVARARPGGGTELTRLEGHGAFAVRRTGPHEVHVVGTAAGPLGGDVQELAVDVGPGARLSVRGVAATIALPGREPGPAEVRLGVEVGAGATASVALPPLVVASGADVRVTTTVRSEGRLDLVERVQRGRHGEVPGDWTGRLVADVAGRPAVRQTQRLVAPWCGLVTRVVLGPDVDTESAATIGRAFVVPLAHGGNLWTAYATDLRTAQADLDRLAGDGQGASVTAGATWER